LSLRFIMSESINSEWEQNRQPNPSKKKKDRKESDTNNSIQKTGLTAYIKKSNKCTRNSNFYSKTKTLNHLVTSNSKHKTTKQRRASLITAGRDVHDIHTSIVFVAHWDHLQPYAGDYIAHRLRLLYIAVTK
jgi:hypothetical protein